MATACYQQALRLYRESGDRYNEADTLQSLGDTYLAAGDPESATRAWQNALTILDELDLPKAAELYAKLGNLDNAPGTVTEADRTRVTTCT